MVAVSRAVTIIAFITSSLSILDMLFKSSSTALAFYSNIVAGLHFLSCDLSHDKAHRYLCAKAFLLKIQAKVEATRVM
jgi:hypothetical protein